MKKILLLIAFTFYLLPISVLADSSLKSFFVKNSIGKNFKKTQGVMLVSKGTTFKYEAYIDGYEITLYTKNNKIRAVFADKNFNVGDISAKEDYKKYRFRILNYYAEKVKGSLTVDESPERAWSSDGKSYGVKCHTTEFGGGNHYFWAEHLNVTVSYFLGSKVWCDNRKDPILEGWSRGVPGTVSIRMGRGDDD